MRFLGLGESNEDENRLSKTRLNFENALERVSSDADVEGASLEFLELCSTHPDEIPLLRVYEFLKRTESTERSASNVGASRTTRTRTLFEGLSASVSSSEDGPILDLLDQHPVEMLIHYASHEDMWTAYWAVETVATLAAAPSEARFDAFERELLSVPAGMELLMALGVKEERQEIFSRILVLYVALVQKSSAFRAFFAFGDGCAYALDLMMSDEKEVYDVRTSAIEQTPPIHARTTTRDALLLLRTLVEASDRESGLDVVNLVRMQISLLSPKSLACFTSILNMDFWFDPFTQVVRVPDGDPTVSRITRTKNECVDEALGIISTLAYDGSPGLVSSDAIEYQKTIQRFFSRVVPLATKLVFVSREAHELDEDAPRLGRTRVLATNALFALSTHNTANVSLVRRTRVRVDANEVDAVGHFVSLVDPRIEETLFLRKGGEFTSSARTAILCRYVFCGDCRRLAFLFVQADDQVSRLEIAGECIGLVQACGDDDDDDPLRTEYYDSTFGIVLVRSFSLATVALFALHERVIVDDEVGERLVEIQRRCALLLTTLIYRDASTRDMFEGCLARLSLFGHRKQRRRVRVVRLLLGRLSPSNSGRLIERKFQRNGERTLSCPHGPSLDEKPTVIRAH